MRSAVVFFAIITVVVGGQASAQGSGTNGDSWACGAVNNGCGGFGTGHTNPGPDPDGDYRYPHTNCEECIIGQQHYGGEYCHGPCSGEFAFQDIRRAALSGDVARVLALAPLAPFRVAVNFSRQAVQITDCTGQIIASLNLPKNIQGQQRKKGPVAEQLRTLNAAKLAGFLYTYVAPSKAT